MSFPIFMIIFLGIMLSVVFLIGQTIRIIEVLIAISRLYDDYARLMEDLEMAKALSDNARTKVRDISRIQAEIGVIHQKMNLKWSTIKDIIFLRSAFRFISRTWSAIKIARTTVE